MLYIVTGANGHLGNNLVRLLKLNNHDVRVLLLKGDTLKSLQNFNLDVYYGDVTDKDSLRPLFDLSKTNYSYQDLCVIHAAGIVSIASKKHPLLDKVNIEGTINILELSQEYNVKQFIYISSVHAIKEPVDDVTITETDHFDPKDLIGNYAKSKAAATKLVYDAYKEGFPATIIHPSGIIGPFDEGKGHITQMIESYLNKKLSTRVNGHYDFVDVRDVASGIYQASLGTHLGCYILSGEYISVKRMFEILKEISGRKRVTTVVARWFLNLIAPIIEWWFKIRKKSLLFTRYSLYTLQSHARFSHEKATQTFGYQPRPIETTILETAMWLIDQKRLHHKGIIEHLKSYFGKLSPTK